MHDNFASATAVAIPTDGGTFTDTPLSTSGLTMETGEPSSASLGAAFSAWARYTPAHSGVATVSQPGGSGSAFGVCTNVWTGTAVNALSQVAANTGWNDLTFPVTAGVTYRIRLARQSTSYTGTHGLAVTGPPTVIVRPPDLPTLTLIPSGTSLVVRWPVGYASTWEIRLNGGAPISLGAVGTHTFTGMVVGNIYDVQVRGTNSAGVSDWTPATAFTFPQQKVWDDFQRTDSASVVGAPFVGPSPTSLAGTWGINGGDLYCSSGLGVIVWETSDTNCDIRAIQGAANHASEGAIFFGQVAGASVDGWRVTFENLAGTGQAGNLSQVSKVIGTTLIGVGSFNAEHLLGEGSECRVVHKDGHLDVYVSGTRVWSGELPEPVRGTRHGFRNPDANPRWDQLSISSVTADADPTPVPVPGSEYEIAPMDAGTTVRSAFPYRGRDTKTQDIAGGA